MKITNFECCDAENNTVLVDAHGNNIAFICPDCGHPVLAVMLANQRGSSSEHSTSCKGMNCEFSCWFSVKDNKLIINRK